MGKKKREHDDESPSSSDSSLKGKKKHKSKEKKHKKDKKHKSHDNLPDVDEHQARLLVQAAEAYLRQQLASATVPVLDKPRDAVQNHSSAPPVVQPLNEDDYFARNVEFSAWLHEYRNTYFSDLLTEDARALFSDFVEEWNSASLAPRYYSGDVTAPRKPGARAWGTVKATPGGGDPKGVLEKEESRAAAATALRVERREWRRDQKEALDELLPAATGRDAIAEKRAVRREAARQQDNSPDRVVLPGGGGDIMGGGDSLAAAKAWEAKRGEAKRHREAAKRDDLAARAATYTAAEDAKLAQFRALLGHGPITIAKRT